MDSFVNEWTHSKIKLKSLTFPDIALAVIVADNFAGGDWLVGSAQGEQPGEGEQQLHS